jgi:hypothetical protein
VIRSATRASRRAAALALLSSAALFAGCNSSSSTAPAVPPTVTTSGAAKAVGAGTASTFVTTDPSGTPTAIGIRLTRSALSNLPSTDTEIDLPLPAQAGPTAFQDVAIDWNPQGHPPPGIYDVPHFDFHFYMIDATTRAQVSPTDPNALLTPPASAIPAGYQILAPQVVPDMGVHWIDPKSPEFNGKPFTTTFIYGFYGGRMTFVEAMMTNTFLQTNPSFSQTIALPQTYPNPGKYYPTGYSVGYDAATDSYVVTLTGLVLR